MPLSVHKTLALIDGIIAEKTVGVTAMKPQDKASEQVQASESDTAKDFFRQNQQLKKPTADTGLKNKKTATFT